MVKVVFLMSDYGHDPTETAVPFTAFKKEGFQVSFATEAGKTPECDSKMLRGVTRAMLGATTDVVKQYDAMASSEEWKNPLSWAAEGFTLNDFDLVFLPGGHEKSVRQVIDSKIVHRLLIDFFPKTKKQLPDGSNGQNQGKKVVGAVCHGVMCLSEAKDAEGRSPIHGCLTTALPTRFEQLAFWGTRTFLGDYYKTYGAGSENVEQSVRKVLADPTQFKNSLAPAPFVVEDPEYNYISARFPNDVALMSEKIVTLLKQLHPETAS